MKRRLYLGLGFLAGCIATTGLARFVEARTNAPATHHFRLERLDGTNQKFTTDEWHIVSRYLVHSTQKGCVNPSNGELSFSANDGWTQHFIEFVGYEIDAKAVPLSSKVDACRPPNSESAT